MTNETTLTNTSASRTTFRLCRHGLANPDCLPRDNRTLRGFRNRISLSAEFQIKGCCVQRQGLEGIVPEGKIPPGNCRPIRRRPPPVPIGRYPREDAASGNIPPPAHGSLN